MNEQTNNQTGSQSAAALLQQVNEAIISIMVGGQSYTIGTRSLTRADLGVLRAMKADLEAQAAAETDGGLFGRTYVAYFEGR